MDRYDVILIIVGVFGFITTLISIISYLKKPSEENNQSIKELSRCFNDLRCVMVELSTTVRSLDESFKAFNEENKTSHSKLWSYNDKQDAKIQNLSMRVGRLEDINNIRNEEDAE